MMRRKLRRNSGTGSAGGRIVECFGCFRPNFSNTGDQACALPTNISPQRSDYTRTTVVCRPLCAPYHSSGRRLSIITFQIDPHRSPFDRRRVGCVWGLLGASKAAIRASHSAKECVSTPPPPDSVTVLSASGHGCGLGMGEGGYKSNRTRQKFGIPKHSDLQPLRNQPSTPVPALP